MKRFYKEVIAWKVLDHPNVVPLLGVPKDRSQLQFAMVSEWMPNGTINQFVKVFRDANRFNLVGFPYGVLPASSIAKTFATSAAR